MIRALKWIALIMFAAVCSLVLVYFALRALAVERQGYSWSEMDWNQDGRTTLAEYFMSSEIGKRTIENDDRLCVEYFSYKDGALVAVTCSPSVDRN